MDFPALVMSCFTLSCAAFFLFIRKQAAAAGPTAAAGTRFSVVPVIMALCLGLPSMVHAQSVLFLGQQISASNLGLVNADGIAINASGTIAVADTGNQRVLRVTPAGAVTQVLSGNFYGGVAIDNAGNIYTSHFNTMYKIAPDNTVTTVTLGIKGDIDDECAPYSYAISQADCENDAVSRGAAIDLQGNVYLSEYEVYGIVVVPAGGGSPFYADTSPFADVDALSMGSTAAGYIYIDDSFNDRIIVRRPDGTYYGVDPPGLNLQGNPCCGHPGLYTNQLSSVGADREGNIYVGGSQHNGGGNFMYRISADGQSFITMPQSGGGTNGIGGVDAGDTLVYINENDQVVRYSLNHVDFGAVPVGTTSSPFTISFLLSGAQFTNIDLYSQGYNPETTGSNAAEFAATTPMSCNAANPQTCSIPVTFTPAAPGSRSGYVVPYNIVGSGANIIAFRDDMVPVIGSGTGANPVFDPAAGPVAVKELNTTVPGAPAQVVMDGAGYIYAALPNSNQVIALAPNGTFTAVNTGSYTLSKPSGVALDGAGDLFIADTGNNRIIEVRFVTEAQLGTKYAGESGPTVVSAPGITLNGPTQLAMDVLDNLFIANTGNNEIDEVKFNGPAIGTGTGNGTAVVTDASAPTGLAVDPSGNVYFAVNSSDIYEYSALQHTVTKVPNGASLGAYAGLAFDAGGTLYSASFYQGIEELHPDGSISNAGINVYGAESIAVTPAGTLLVGVPSAPSGYSGTVLYEVQRSTPPSLSFSTIPVGQTSSDSPREVDVNNAGNKPLAFSQLAYPADFPETGADSTACTASTSLTAGLGCTLSIGFSPTTAGPLSESVTLTTNTMTGTSAQKALPVIGTGNNGGLSQTISGYAGSSTAFTRSATYSYSFGGTLVYASSNSGLPVTLTVLSGPGNFEGSNTITTSTGGTQITFTGVGTISLLITQSGNATYAPAPSVMYSFPITPASLTIRSYTATEVYGTGVVKLTDVLTPLVHNTDQVYLQVTSQVAANTPVGTAPITFGLTGPLASAYVLGSSYTNGTATVTPAPLTVAANDSYMLAGGSLPAMSFTLEGLAAGDTAATAVTGAPQLSTTATAASPAGSYPINLALGTLAAANYTLTAANGNLNILSPISFGTIAVGQYATQTINFQEGLSSTLGSTLGVTNALGANVFSSAPVSCSAGNCTATLTFAPTQPGSWSGALDLFDQSQPAKLLLSIPATGNAASSQIVFVPSLQSVVGGGLQFPTATAADSAGNLYIADVNNNRVVDLPAGGGPQITVGSGFNEPYGVAVDSLRNVYVADTGNHRIVELPVGGGAQVVLATGFSFISGIAVDSATNVYVTDSISGIVEKIPAGGGAPVALGSGWGSPFGIAVDGSGNVYVSDTNLNRIVELPAAGGQVILPISGLNAPYGVAVDNPGNIFVSDTVHHMVVELPAGASATIPILTGLSYPYQLSIDGEGNLYVPDSSNNRVLSINPYQPPSLTFPSTTVGATSASQSVTIFNTGNQALTFATPGSGTNPSYPSNFPMDAGATCNGTTLAPGSSCVVSAHFAPTVAGSNSGAILLTDNNLTTSTSASQSIPMSGTGVQLAPKASVKPGSLTFQPRLVGVTSPMLTTTLTNVGTDVLQIASVAISGTNANDFMLTNSCGSSLAVNASCSAGVTFKPTAAGSRTAAITFTDNAGNVTGAHQTVNLNGTGFTPAAAPTFSPTATIYPTAQLVAISSTTPGATIYYTTDKTTPTTGSSLYSAPVTVSKNTTLKAIAVATGYGTSAVSVAAYTIRAAPPTFSPPAALYPGAQSVSINSATAGATIYYTTNGTTPTISSSVYSAQVVISKNTTLKAIAVATGYGTSVVSVSAYTIRAAAPTFSPPAALYPGAQSVTISSTTPGSTIYYTTDGTTPTISSSAYSAPVVISKITTLKAIAVATGYATSLVSSGFYSIRTAAPVFTPPGGTYSTAQSVKISSTTPGASIYYTTDGTVPTTSSNLYSTPVVVSKTATIKAIAVASGYGASIVGSAKYTIP